MEVKLIDVAHVYKRGASLGITVPKAIVKRLRLQFVDFVAFAEVDGKLVVEKLVDADLSRVIEEKLKNQKER